MNGHHFILLADIGDILTTLVPVVFVIIWIVSQVMGAMGGNKQQPRMGQPRPPQKPEAQNPPQDLANEIEIFLRKVQGGSEQPHIPPPQPAEIIEAEIIDAEPVPRPVARPISPKAARAVERLGDRHLGEVVGHADERIERHLHEVFDHEIGALEDTSDEIHEDIGEIHEDIGDIHEKIQDAESESGGIQIPDTAQELRDLFADAENIRKAVILSEVFSRSDDRF